MIILLPPSEGKKPGGVGFWRPKDGTFGSQLHQARTRVMSGLETTPSSALKVRGALAEHVERINATLRRSPALPAWERYNGVVYQGLDYTSLSAQERRVANRSVVIVSGLGGLIGLDDPLPDYRAPIDARVSELGRLSTFWQPRLAPVLAALAERHVIVDVLPMAHRSAMTSVGTWLTIDVVNRNGEGGHAAKHAKGRFVRWALSHQDEKFSKWRDGDWRVVVR